MHKYAARPQKVWGLSTGYVSYPQTLEICEVYHKIKIRHAKNKLGNVGALRYNTLIPTTKGDNMSNVIKVPHTVNFIAEINLDKIEANLIAPLLALSEEDLVAMCKQATLATIDHVKLVEVANEGSAGWAHVSLAE
jgi:hypothetical protein